MAPPFGPSIYLPLGCVRGHYRYEPALGIHGLTTQPDQRHYSCTYTCNMLSEVLGPKGELSVAHPWGSDCRHVYKHNLGLKQVQQKDVAATLVAVERYFTPAKNVIFERYVFNNLKQEEAETIDGFFTKLGEKCEALRDEPIRDRLVLGITEEGGRRRLGQ